MWRKAEATEMERQMRDPGSDHNRSLKFTCTFYLHESNKLLLLVCSEWSRNTPKARRSVAVRI